MKPFRIFDFGFSIDGCESKKVICFAFCALHFALSFPADAQQAKKVARIGFLSGRSEPTPTNPDPTTAAFRQGLRDLGHIEGKNILIEYRYAAGMQDRWPSLVAELVQLKVDVFVIISGSSPERVGKNGSNVASLRGGIACFSGQKICHDLERRKHQRLCDTNRFPAFCPEQQEPCDLKTKLRPT